MEKLLTFRGATVLGISPCVLSVVSMFGCHEMTRAKSSHVFDAGVVPSKAAPAWRFTGNGVKEADAVTFPTAGVMKIDTGPNQRARWIDMSSDGFGAVDPKKGFRAEIGLQVLKSTAKNRGIDFEAYVGDGASKHARYFITVTRSGVYWLDKGFFELAEGLDNHSAIHTYRLSVGPDGKAQIYRDGKLLGTRSASRESDVLLKTKGPYLQWGEGAGESEADALVDYVTYSLSGP